MTWEYCIEWLDEYAPRGGAITAEAQACQLSILGLQGWEAFAVDGLKVYLKRRRIKHLERSLGEIPL